jgi:dephospho-CoA kinase
MIVIGLTGSIGMGKSTVARMFTDADIAVWDADQSVHDAYDFEDHIYSKVREWFPEVCTKARVDRAMLGDVVFKYPDRLRDLERLLGHHLEMSRAKFIADARYDMKGEHRLVVLDIPLLFENPHLIRLCDYVVTVHCPEGEQRRRVLDRPGMTEQRFKAISAQQIPSPEKVARSDLAIDTSQPLLETKRIVGEIIEHCEDEHWWTVAGSILVSKA